MKSCKLKLAIGVCAVAIAVLAARALDLFGSMTGSEAAAGRLIDRARSLPNPATDRLVYSLQQRLREKPDDSQSLALLGNAYLQKVRETGDPSFYEKAQGVLQKAVDRDPQNAEALSGIGALCLARHEFSEALDWGRRAVAANPYKAAAFGVVGDALLELGRYDEAVETVQKMVNVRPDLSSYSRVSYVRELMGDLPGAIAAMRLAVGAGAPALENTNWCRVQLGFLHFNSGALAAAEVDFRKALSYNNGYAPALFGMARLAAASGRIQDAIATLEGIVTSMPLPEYVIELGDLYEIIGDSVRASIQFDLARALHALQQDNGVQTDAELALFLADRDLDMESALGRAQEAIRQRPSVVAADILAWTLYKCGRFEDAALSIQQALRLGSKNALMHYHAGMIFLRRGERDRAIAHLQTSLDLNPHFSTRHAPEARKVLSELLSGRFSEPRGEPRPDLACAQMSNQ